MAFCGIHVLVGAFWWDRTDGRGGSGAKWVHVGSAGGAVDRHLPTFSGATAVIASPSHDIPLALIELHKLIHALKRSATDIPAHVDHPTLATAPPVRSTDARTSPRGRPGLPQIHQLHHPQPPP